MSKDIDDDEDALYDDLDMNTALATGCATDNFAPRESTSAALESLPCSNDDDDDDVDDGLYDDLDMSSCNIKSTTGATGYIKSNYDGETFAATRSPALPTTSSPYSSSTTISLPMTTSLTTHVETLTQTVLQLTTENETLRRNMGILFRTARAELQRKDDEIRRLQVELDTKER